MGNTQSEHFKLVFSVDIEKTAQVEPDNSHELVNVLVLLAFDPKILGYELA